MNDLPIVVAAVLAGLAVALGIWALRGWILERYRRDCAWMQGANLRFHPEPLDERLYTLGMYGAYLVLLLVLVALVAFLPLALLLWVGCLFLPRMIVGWAWRRRLREIDLQIPQCVSTLANSMRAGLTLVQAITRLSEQAPQPIRSEFKIMANQYGYGADMDTVIRNAKARLELPNFSLFASALLLNREMGGDISETLTRISKSLEKLREMRKTVEAHTSEGRTNIRVLLVAPVFMLLLMATVVPRGVGMLFTTAPGAAILTVAVVLAGAGVYIANRITRTEV
jgi:tight adherence protein B